MKTNKKMWILLIGYSLSIGSNYILSEEAPSERQPLLKTLTTRLEDESERLLQAETRNDVPVERDLDELIY